MHPNDRYDSLIQYYAEKHDLNWRLIKKQIGAESSFNPAAVNQRTGARGLAQWMPDSWNQWDDQDDIPALNDPHNPEEAIGAMCKYMAFLYSRFAEIPDKTERWKFAVASYNCGRANVNDCLEYAREAARQPGSFSEWVEAGRPSGPWQRWEFASRFLSLITGEDALETIHYVAKIMGPEKGARLWITKMH